MAALEAKACLKDTLILFTSDNGPVLDDGYKDSAVELLGKHKPAGSYRGGKYSRFEGGTRVPWIACWPGRVPIGTSDALLSQVDLLTSLATIAGAGPIPLETACDSCDARKALLGESQEGRKYVVENSGVNNTLAIRRGRWKYLEPLQGVKVFANTQFESGNDPQSPLFNLDRDPGEQENIADQHPEIVIELDNLLKEIKATHDRQLKLEKQRRANTMVV